MKTFFVILSMLLVVLVGQSQIEKVGLKLDYNAHEDVFDCKMVILKGEAKDPFQRIMLSTQIGMVLKANTSIDIVNPLNPIQNNMDYEGTIPCDWHFQTIVDAPDENPAAKYCGIIPAEAPSSFFNDLHEGDEVPLFSVKLLSEENCMDTIRFFDPEIDPDLINGGDFSIGLKIGTINTIDIELMPGIPAYEMWQDTSICAGMDYMGHTEPGTYITGDYVDENGCKITVRTTLDVLPADDPSCLESGTDHRNVSVINLSPNPARDMVRIESDKVMMGVQLYAPSGRLVFDDKKVNSNEYVLDRKGLPSGLYTIKIYLLNETIEKEIIFID